MSHSEMPHQHTGLAQHHSTMTEVSTGLTIQQHTHTFWTISNSIEIIIIFIVIGVWMVRAKVWRQHPYIFVTITFLFVISMHPVTDSIARHSVWLHCLQSSLIHHLIPLLLLLSQTPKATVISNRPASKTMVGLLIFSLVTFNLMTLMWLLPSLHVRLMQDALLYSMMKWAMVITGILLCKSMQLFNQNLYIARLNYNQFNALMLMPQVFIGIALMILPPLYAMPESIMQHDAHSIISYLPQLSLQMDQVFGGLLLLLAIILFLLIDIKRRRNDLNLSTSMHIHKEII
ncbi:hypothetical protein F4V57_10295 [Acinetobacter qingfengensis]|uniref:Cytochrome c oxidase assembly protein n=1 Tax=Acinetobacter qingfengensis TaxID=1262585 RepID=A0A1E7R5A2_9GAMM|nr:cytochrome c oxidase assembly protein [Acinetobacter qingfengensis]KAA8732448.1 hypothetical protein F4V57_10295 [Acinetobacter qingfengensis]OEY94443.1 hypothetical protein BJI46_03630 [Acinetobacter qingfengensis]